MNQIDRSLTRRQVLKAAAASSLAVAAARKSHAADDPGRVLRIGVIGVGARGSFLMQTALTLPQIEVPAVCDISRDLVNNAQNVVESASGKRPTGYCAGPEDWKNLVERDDLDAVVIATPWDLHARQAVAVMRAGIFVGLEVPACLTLPEAWELIDTSEQTGSHCMLLENVNYFRNTMAVDRMVHEGVLGSLHHVYTGYIHDCRFLAFLDDGTLAWRGEHMARLNGNLYPTHPIGPTARWLDINRGDRFVRLSSVSTRSEGLREYAKARFGADHPLAKRSYAQGDTNTTMIETQNGATVTLYFDLCTPRPSDIPFTAFGTKGCYEATRDVLSLEGATPEAQWESFTGKYQEQYEHPLWKRLAKEAAANGGHGGCDYIMMHEFVGAARSRRRPPIDVYDAVTWSAIVPLSISSVAKNGQMIDFPDFTRGRWKRRKPAD